MRNVLNLIWSSLIVVLLSLSVLNAQDGKNAPPATPEVNEFRQKVTFDDPYKSLPENPMPRKTVTSGTEEPNVHIETSDAIDHMMELHRNMARPTGNKGYRIQIYSGNNTGAGTTRSQFIAMYDDVDIYTVFEQPIFKVRIGNFKTQKEADDFCKEVKVAFPAAFVVPDIIEEEQPQTNEPPKE